MLERVLEQQQILYVVLMEKKEKHVRALLPDLIYILKPFVEAKKVLSGSKNFTACFNSTQAYLYHTKRR